jgi:hypothetical protein
MGDPEMYGYLRAALRSLATRRDRFRGSVAGRLLTCLSALESDQVEMLKVIWKDELDGGLRRETFETGFGPYRQDNLNALASVGLVTEQSARIVKFQGGVATTKWLTALGHDFLRFVEVIEDVDLPPEPQSK